MNTHKSHLELAQRHVQEGEQRVARQRALLTELVRDGHDITLAQVLLQTLEATLVQMRDHLQRLQSQHN